MLNLQGQHLIGSCGWKVQVGDDNSGEHFSLSPNNIRVSVLGWESLRNADTAITLNVFAALAKTCSTMECTSG